MSRVEERHRPDAGPDADIAWLTLAEASDAVRSRRVSPIDLTARCLARIERFNDTLNAFITVTAGSAMAEARAAEAEIQRGRWKGPLHGIPIALKDLVDTAGVRTTGASNVFRDRIPGQDAEIVRRLRRAGAVLLGKLNLHELAFGATGVISCFGAVRNPWDPDHIAGGSSAGAGAAVAAGLCYGAVGTDTGGSIREPAAFCGIVGLKPTFGRVSTRGVIPLSGSLDHVGPMTRTARDAALMLQVLAGHDPQDAGSRDAPVADYLATIDERTSPLRLGIPRALFYDALHSDVQAAMDAAIGVLGTLTASRHDVGPLATSDEYGSVLDPYRFVFSAESYAYHQTYAERTPDLYHPDTLKRVRAGGKVGNAAYVQALRQLDAIRLEADSAFGGVDLLITPTSPVPAPASADLPADPRANAALEMLLLRNTRVFNALGLPTISVPCGFTREGLPIGMQITGPRWGEETVLRLAHAYERATEWHTHRPPIE